MKFKSLIIIVVFYLLAVVGMGWYTYDITDASKASKAIETIKLVFIAIGGLAIIIPAYINIFNSYTAIATIEDQRKISLIDNTFQLLQKWDDSALLEARRYTRVIKDKEKTLSHNDIIEHINSSSELRQSVILLYNYFDLIRVSIENNRIDVGVLKDAMSETIIDICSRFDPWMKSQSKVHNKHVADLLAHLK